MEEGDFVCHKIKKDITMIVVKVTVLTTPTYAITCRFYSYIEAKFIEQTFYDFELEVKAL